MMTPGKFKQNDSYTGPLEEYLKTPSGMLLTQMMLETDAALDLPPQIESLLKGMDVMQMLAFNHACLIGWRAACRFIQDCSRPVGQGATTQVIPFSQDPRVKDWDDQIAAHQAKLNQTKTPTTP